MNLKKTLIALIFPAAFININAYAHEDDDPLLANFMIDKLERSNSQTNFEAQAWIGRDLNKLWLKTDIKNHSGEIEHAELQALYSHAISPYWDAQFGIRQDNKPSPQRTWGVIGIQGLAPYFFDIDAAIFMGEAGRTAARISAEYDFLFTQRLILSPKLEINAYGQNDDETGTDSGLSDINAGLRLRYEIYREFAPYIGISWNKKYGETESMARNKNESIKDTEWVIGLRMWF